ncbi:MAG: dockerin type I repeat-containing protein [Ruminococcus sp.]|uniref:dockerin type I repeat-containing protein n=1 Tax=Ruminococcus sp. TaxID=41978 RepID=UPI0025EC94A5|nr:dockerin type I repeat-containing protein [Ruminococcus sp.]MCR5600644.1 dockerin type I repeat-containing protein [Ruminococcus sp.]
MTEFKDYREKHGDIAVVDNYVTFCLETAGGTNYSWTNTSNYDYGEGIFGSYSQFNCSEVAVSPPPGSPEYVVDVNQADNDGLANLSWSYAPRHASEKVAKVLNADCMITDNTKTVLLPEMVRIKIVDADTGELLTDPVPQITPQIKVSEDGIYVDHSFEFDSNPYIWNDDIHLNSDYFKLELKQNNIPDGYTLPEDFEEVTKYVNGAMDIVFKLKKSQTDLPTGATRITLLDSTTGKPVPNYVLVNRPYSFRIDIRIRDMYTGPIYTVNSNPCTYVDNLAAVYKDADSFTFSCDEQPEITVNDNDSMEIVLRIKPDRIGDVNSDGIFSLSDLVMLQRWLLGRTDAKLTNWEAADFCKDDKIDVFDLCLMRKALLIKGNVPYALSVILSGGVEGIFKEYKVYSKDDGYFLSYYNRQSRMKEPLVIELSEEEYHKLMSLDYSKYISYEDYDKYSPTISDAIYSLGSISCVNGYDLDLNHNVGSLIKRLEDIVIDYTRNQKI